MKVELKQRTGDPNSGNVYVSFDTPMGRGVFAKRRILRDEVIERAPVIVIPNEQWAGMEDSVLSDYAYDWGVDDEHAVIALGYVSIYNHSYEPNANLASCLDEGIMEVTALRDIEPDEEIRVNYKGEHMNESKLWFEVTES